MLLQRQERQPARPKVGESNQQVKQLQPEANAKSGSDQPAKMNPKAGVMNVDPAQGQTSSKGVAAGTVGGDTVKVDAPKQGAKVTSQPDS